MKRLLVLPLILLLTSCAPEPEPKHICTKSHNELKYEYAPKLKTDGTMGYGMTWVSHEVCDKEEPNPKYGGAFND
jgi:hypothetical protein